jgi:hypothetical protein
LILLSKTKSLLRRFRQRSASDAEYENDRKKPDEWTTTGDGKKPADLSLVSEGAPTSQPSVLQDSKPTNGSLPEILPPLDFVAEAPAESFFNANPGRQARGSFHEVDAVRWDHEETDWSLEEFEFEQPPVSALQYMSRSPSHTEHQEAIDEDKVSLEVGDAFERLRAFASSRHWRAAASALEKAAKQSPRLTKRERAAIERILDAAAKLTRYQTDSRILRNELFSDQAPNENPEPANEAIKSTNREAGISQKASDRRNLKRKTSATSRNPTQKDIRLSILEIRKIAADRKWLSPKSSRALTRIGDKKANLGRSERNALNHLLDRCGSMPELKEHVATLQRAIAR